MNTTTPWAIYEKLQRRDPSSLTDDERLILAFGEIRTEVNSGGFDSYLRYPYRRNASTAAQAARVARCPAIADLIEAAIVLIGSDLIRADEDTVAARLDQLEDDLEQLDQRFYDLENKTDLDAALARLTARLT